MAWLQRDVSPVLTRASLAVVLAAVALTSACGKDDPTTQTTTDTKQTTTSTSPRPAARQGVCRPVPGQGARSPRTVESSRAFTFQATGKSKFELRVERAVELTSFKDEFTSRGRYRPGGDTRLVAVVYRFANRTTQRAEAASAINKLATLVDARGMHYASADGADACAAASPSAAVRLRASSPEEDVPGNGSYRTVAVYAVPKAATGLRWTVGQVQVAVQPRPSGGRTR